MKRATSEHRVEATVLARIAPAGLASAARRLSPGHPGVTRCVSPHRAVTRQ